MANVSAKARKYLSTHHPIMIYLTIEEHARLELLLRKHHTTPTQWARRMIAIDEAHRTSEAEHFVRKTVLLNFAQDVEQLCAEKADFYMAMARRYHGPGQWGMQRSLRQDAGRYMNHAGFCREVINDYEGLDGVGGITQELAPKP